MCVLDCLRKARQPCVESPPTQVLSILDTPQKERQAVLETPEPKHELSENPGALVLKLTTAPNKVSKGLVFHAV
jgi:hypothetical protein